MGNIPKSVAHLFIKNMNKIFIIFFLLTGILQSQISQRVNLKITKDNNNSKEWLLAFGVDSKASYGLDGDLGELLYPPPPPTFYVILEFIDSTRTDSTGKKIYDLIWTNLDLRPIPDNTDKWYERYKMNIYWTNTSKVKIEWNNINLLQNIDSIFVRDVMGGIVINEDMKKTNYLELNNDLIDKLFFHVYYTKYPANVKQKEKSIRTLYPNPFNNEFNINFDDFYKIDLFNSLGQLIGTFNQINQLKFYYNGLYFIKFYLNDNSIITFPIVKN